MIKRMVKIIWHKMWASFHHSRSYAIYGRYTPSASDLDARHHGQRYCDHCSAIHDIREGGKAQ